MGIPPVRREGRDRGCGEPGGHTIDKIRTGKVSFAVDGGSAPTRMYPWNAHQA